MKHRLVLFACCLLVLGGFNAAAQESTAPLPPPDRSTSPLPAPGEDAPAPSAPSRDNSSGSASSGGSASRSTARTPARQAPARAAPAQPAAASTQEGIPDKGMFWGAMLGGSYNEYHILASGRDHGGGSFNTGLMLGYDWGLLAGQVELLFTGEGGHTDYWYNAGGSYGWYETSTFSGTALQIPVMLKLDLHWKRLMFQPQAGFYLNFALGDLEVEDYRSGKNSYEYSNPLLGVMIGGAIGVRIGRGYLFMDSRYTTNLGKTKVNGSEVWEKYSVMTNFGYQYYFRSRQ